MAGLIISSDIDFIYVDFSEVWNGKAITHQNGKFRRSHISEVVKKKAGNNEWVSATFANNREEWDFCTESNPKTGAYPIKSIDGANIVAFDDLFNKISGLAT